MRGYGRANAPALALTSEAVGPIVLEFTRAERAGEAHAFRFAPQTYLLRTPGGGFNSAEFPWTRALLDDLRAVRDPSRGPEVVHRLGEALRGFLAGAGWDAQEREIVRAVHAGEHVHITIRSAAAELYALPWELLALRSTGQLLGAIPGLLVRYEWPDTASFPDRVAPADRRGRVLLAWSAAGGAVPAADHLAAIHDALGPAFDPARDVLAHASYAAIADALAHAQQDGPPIDALHLLCHGAQIGGSYGLALDDEQGGGSPVVVDAGRLQQLLAPHAAMLRLVTLAACDSGDGGDPGNLLGSVAQMIHRAGIRALIASRFPLSVPGSSRLAATLYPALARGDSLEMAVVAARAALARDPGQLDWASMQLYSREADGESTLVFGTGPKAPVPEAMPVVSTPSTPTALTPPAPRRRWPLWLAGGALAAVAVTFLALQRTPEPDPAPTTPVHPVAAPDPTPVTPNPTPVPPAPVTTPQEPPPTETTPPLSPTKDPVKPTRPAVQPAPSNQACPDALKQYLANLLPTAAAPTSKVELELGVDASAKLSVRVRSGAGALKSSAASHLERGAPAKLVKLGAGRLPCKTTLTWFQ